MRRSSLVTTITLAGALAFGAAAAFAQRGGGGHGGGGGGHMGGGGGGRMGGGGGGRMGGGGGGRMGGGGHAGGGHVSGAPSGGGMRGGGQVFAPGAGVPRGSAGVRGGTVNRGAWAYPYYYPPYPYYPNYPYYPYPYPYAPAGPGYSVAPPVDETSDITLDATVGTAGVQPDQSNLGGMSFEITPSDAQVFVDGNYVGTVGQFTPTTQPLGAPPGGRHLEIRDIGYKTMSFDVDIVAGQVIPYQGQMER